MSSYVVTGASRGIGWAFLDQLSLDANNTVIAIVRNKPATEQNVLEKLPGRPNIHILEADITNYDALQSAAADTAKITGGSLDYLIANAGLISHHDAFDPIGVLGQNPRALEDNLLECFQVNVVGQIHLFNIFIPLILKGSAKKVIALSSGQADPKLVLDFNIDVAPSYSISKAALNFAITKFSAQYAKDGVLFMSISPGLVDTGHFNELSSAQSESIYKTMASFKTYAPDFKGPITPEESVKDMMKVIEGASLENGDGGAFVSHKGNQQWL
ncbi:conserved hypothetical protein [Uncinocarpus reesii 1704]|uniref:Short chain dehydrogenase n=1 Tax=Uncinocarpus reesii (strain UAMH 1704) TaxID=336963 RepID=C4JH37_UNCRE|nr:uncharacterized protein UREG_01288 [Uncinocarpus reesii 1704]EEP76439.1 conserved hypothetical protein [Uncinocarpus reesii 1704]